MSNLTILKVHFQIKLEKVQKTKKLYQCVVGLMDELCIRFISYFYNIRDCQFNALSREPNLILKFHF